MIYLLFEVHDANTPMLQHASTCNCRSLAMKKLKHNFYFSAKILVDSFQETSLIILMMSFDRLNFFVFWEASPQNYLT